MSGISSKAAGGLNNKEKYNGKELQREEFSEGSGLEVYDYANRYYDPQLGRFNTIDKIADNFYNWSPYVYVYNNPIKYIDPDGNGGILAFDDEHHILTISASLIFYGNGASEKQAKQTALNIENQWNAAGGQVTINGVKYDVKFSVSGNYIDAGTKGTLFNQEFSKIVENNKEISKNYIEVSNEATTSASGGTSGLWAAGRIGGDCTTQEAHEFGHLLGLPDANFDNRGKGLPGIMVAAGSGVDAPYTIDGKTASTVSTIKNGKPSSFKNPIDINSRVVTPQNVTELGVTSRNAKTLGSIYNGNHN